MTLITDHVSRKKSPQTGEKSAPHPTCETCLYLSEGFRCQRITRAYYSRFIEFPNATFCPRFERHWAKVRRVRDG